MDFSKKYLLKYGWEEGQGLGKMKDGIKSAIRPKLKFDKAGMGFDPSTEFTDSWWIKVYNDALENVNIKNQEIAEDENNGDEGEPKKKAKSKKRKNGEETFNEMFNACEGRTVHKGARHSLGLGGKLRRLEQQELQLLSKKESTEKVGKESSGLSPRNTDAKAAGEKTQEYSKPNKVHKKKDKSKSKIR